ncbi:MAG: insulinase family protein [Clostridia bacterium]|nr:insulinase family protein [Clostridia bacterium]
MKKLVSVLLCLCMALSVMSALAEAAADGPAALPEVGDLVEGFEVLEVREYPIIGARIALFEHQKTGAKLMYFANDDTDRAFQLSFLTETIDDTGLPHVFEHSTLDGSEKYPSKSLFFNLSYQTYNTYMNAYTQNRMTCYPISSLSEEQLLKLADFYTDSCLHPMILEDESIYREEAWRYRLNSPEDPLTIEGTVYSEMLGSMSMKNRSYYNAMRRLFPGAFAGNVSGGDPEHIPDMTWDMLKEYHERYYHPSNCMAYLYGSFEDYSAFLALLDEAFSPYEKREQVHVEEPYAQIQASVTEEVPYPVEAGYDTDHASVIYYGFVCPGLTQDEELVLNTLTDLLIAGSSAFQQAVRDTLPSSKAACYIETEAPDAAIVFTLEHADPEDAETFRSLVNETLEEVARDGFPQDMVDGVMASLSIKEMLVREGTNVGVESILENFSYDYSCSGDPWGYMAYTDALGSMDEWNQQGIYAEAVRTHLLNNERTALVTTRPEPGLKEQRDEALRARLAEVKAAMTEEELAGIIAASNAQEAEDDASAYVRQLQAVTVDSLPEELPEVEVIDETDEAGVRRIEVPAAVEGIGQASIFLDAAGIAQEDVHWFKLLTVLAGEMDTMEHTRAELSVLMSRYLYNGKIYISLPGSGDDCHPYLRMSWIGRDEDLEKGYDLMYELLFDMDLSDASRVLEVVRSTRASLKASINSSPYSAQLYTAIGGFSDVYAYYAYVNYLPWYDFLTEAEQALTEDPQSVLARLTDVRADLKNRTGAVLLYAGSEEGIRLNRNLGRAFLDKLDEVPIEPAAYVFPAASASEALIVDGSVQFNGITAPLDALGKQGYDASLDAVTALISDVFLYPLLRDQYGAYSVIHSATEDANAVYIITYRDPNITESFEVFDQLPDLVASMDIDQETLDGYILSSYAYYAQSNGALSSAVNAGVNVLTGKDPAKNLEYMRQLKALKASDLKEYAAFYEALSVMGTRFTAGSASAINRHADLYDSILNPFNAVDAAAVEFTDVPVGHEYYAAVRFAFEEGLMQPADETEFGVDETASNADLFTALYVLIGGPADAEEGLRTFAEYGLADASMDLTEPLDPGYAGELMAALVDEETSGIQAEGPVTRGEFASMLMDFVNSTED